MEKQRFEHPSLHRWTWVLTSEDGRWFVCVLKDGVESESVLSENVYASKDDAIKDCDAVDQDWENEIQWKGKEQ